MYNFLINFVVNVYKIAIIPLKLCFCTLDNGNKKLIYLLRKNKQINAFSLYEVWME